MYTKCQYQYKRGDNMANMCGKPVFDDHYYCFNCFKTRRCLNSVENNDYYSCCKIQRYDDIYSRDPLTEFVFYKYDGLIFIIGVHTADGIRDVTDEELILIQKHGWVYEPFPVKGAIED